MVSDGFSEKGTVSLCLLFNIKELSLLPGNGRIVAKTSDKYSLIRPKKQFFCIKKQTQKNRPKPLKKVCPLTFRQTQKNRARGLSAGWKLPRTAAPADSRADS